MNINLRTSLGLPDSLSFCPTNWRRIGVVYKSELNVWNLDQFDNERIKAKSQRFVAPVTEASSEDEQVASEFKHDFETSLQAITEVHDVDEERIAEILDKRTRHELACFCWLNTDELLVSTKANHIFKVTNKNIQFSYLF